jgi:CheY-like chemotaxis protein
MPGFVAKTVILLADDETEHMASTQAILDREGYPVFSAPTAEVAVELCTMLHFDLIVSRVMPQ